MTKAEANKILKEIEISSSKELEDVISMSRASEKRNKGIGAALGFGAGALAGAASGNSPWSSVVRGLLGGLLAGGAGYGLGSLAGSKNRELMYNEVKRRKGERMADLLSQLDDVAATKMQGEMSGAHSGIQTNDTDYGMFVSGKGKYSGDDRLTLKRDEDGRPVLSLLFAGINSSVEDGGPASAKSPLAARFYNRNRGKFSDVQANTVFDDPIVSDAYIDKIVSKIMANRAKTGKYPRMRVVGYSAGGRGVVNFLQKMRERDPNFKVDEIIGIDPYQRPWESIPASLRDNSNPVADRIVYSRLADNYTGSTQKGLGRIGDTISNTFVSLLGKKLKGLSARTVIENHIPNISHTDADQMYDSALEILSNLRAGKGLLNKEKEQK